MGKKINANMTAEMGGQDGGRDIFLRNLNNSGCNAQKFSDIK